jgi:hypothetical protein
MPMLLENVDEKPGGMGRIYFVLGILVSSQRKVKERGFAIALTHSGRTQRIEVGCGFRWIEVLIPQWRGELHVD